VTIFSVTIGISAAALVVDQIELDKIKGYCNGCWEEKFCFTLPCPTMKNKEAKDQLHKYCEPCLITNYKIQFTENRIWECGMRNGDGTYCSYKMNNLDGFSLTEDSQAEIDSLLAKVYYAEQPDIQFCPNPNCEAPCKLTNAADQVVVCQVSDCNTSFCFYCLQIQRGAKCSNPDCNSSALSSLLASSPQIVISAGVKGPQTRMCPKCGVLMDHVSGCKHSTCRNCSYAFCHVCLVEPAKWNVAPCNSGWVMCNFIAPPQTVSGLSKRDLRYNDL